jgi:stage II sporulation protein GA (sporulation sigma-E factor processing peptidase)
VTVYLDIILIENICMNYIILLATGLIVKNKINGIRIFLSSTLGGIYAITSYTTNLAIYSNIIMKIILSIAMIYLAFKPQNIKTMLKQLVIFYLTSFAFGGCAFALLYFIKPQNILMKNGVYIGTYPLKIAILGGIVGFIIINISFKIIKQRINKKTMFCDIEIYLKEKEINVHALVDTGNLLREPITGNSVIVVEKEKLYNLISNRILDNVEEIMYGKNNLENIDSEYISKLRLIPFSSLGTPNGMLIGIQVDKIVIHFEEEKINATNVIVGIYNKSLTKNNQYNALVGLDLLDNQKMLN